MAQHAMGLGFNLTERGGCFTEVQEVWPSMQWDLASNLTEREVVALQRCKRYGPACNGT